MPQPAMPERTMTRESRMYQTDLFEDRKLLSLPTTSAIDATDAETLANIIEILTHLQRRLDRYRETTLLRTALTHLKKFEADRATAAS